MLGKEASYFFFFFFFSPFQGSCKSHVYLVSSVISGVHGMVALDQNGELSVDNLKEDLIFTVIVNASQQTSLLDSQYGQCTSQQHICGYIRC